MRALQEPVMTTFEDFCRQAAQTGVNVVALARPLSADLETPLGAYIRLATGDTHSFLLESVEGGERLARWCFLGAGPTAVVRGRGQNTTVERLGRTERHQGVRAIDHVRSYFKQRKAAQPASGVPFGGGCVGYLGFNAVHWFEPALANQPAQCADDAMFMFFDTVVAFDRVKQQMVISRQVLTDGTQDRHALGMLYEEAAADMEAVATKLRQPLRAMGDLATEATAIAAVSNCTRGEFEAGVARVKEHIAAGDCYQVVLSQKFTATTSADPVEIYRALRFRNPAPYMFFVRTPEESLIGASPEVLVRCRGGALEYRPIAGTRRRGVSEDEDARLAAELAGDEKERAEHMMLVDLGRNDLGRVAEYGSVRVEQLMKVERYSQVQHLVTELRAQLRQGLDAFDALAACFPAGTVTGAPKVRAIEILRELEPEPRGVYAGAVLYADHAGNLDSCIAIRTIHLRGEAAEVQAGAGIVADSVPALEYEETLSKARALLMALGAASERGRSHGAGDR